MAETVVDRPELSVVIPAFNEVDRLGPTLARVHEYVDEAGLGAEIREAEARRATGEAVLLLLALLCALLGVAYRSTPKIIMRLVTDTSLGRIILPTEEDHEAALDNVAKE